MKPIRQKQLFILFMLLMPLWVTSCDTLSATTNAGAVPTGSALTFEFADNGDAFTVEGYVQPQHTLDVSFPFGGQVKEILVQVGEPVTAGQVLARLDTTEADIALAQAHNALTTAEAALTVAQAELQASQVQQLTAQDDVALAQANLELVQAPPSDEALAVAEATIAAAESAIIEADGNRDAVLTVSQSQVLAAQAQLFEATALRQESEERYEFILNNCYTLPTGEEFCPLYGSVEEVARAQLAATQANEVAAQQAFDLLQAGPRLVEISAASGTVMMAEANLAVAQAELEALLAPVLPEQVAVVETAVMLADVGLRQVEQQLLYQAALVTQAEINVTQAQIVVAEAELALSQMQIVAPFAGTVTEIGVNMGEVVGAGQQVMIVADLSAWEVTTVDLTELDVPFIQIDDTLPITIKALPEATLTGTVTEVAVIPGRLLGDVVYVVTLSLPADEIIPWRWNMTASVQLGDA